MKTLSYALLLLSLGMANYALVAMQQMPDELTRARPNIELGPNQEYVDPRTQQRPQSIARPVNLNELPSNIVTTDLYSQLPAELITAQPNQ